MQSKKQNEKVKNEVRDLWETLEQTNIQVMGVLARRKKGVEKISEDIIIKSFPNLILKTNKQTLNYTQDRQ